MRVFGPADDFLPFRNAVVTLGSYDGVHYGHRALLSRVRERAETTAGESVVVTFSPHPRQVLPRGGDVRLLNSLSEKAYLLEETGIENLVVLPFTEEFARTEYRDFIKDTMVGRIGMRWLVVGYDHHFGHGQQGDYDSLMALGCEFGFGVERVHKHELDDDKVSSSAVRRLISSGEMNRAAELLTRPYIMIGKVTGKVVASSDPAKLLPPPGTYPVKVVNGSREGDDRLHISPTEVTLDNEYPCGSEILITFS